jgi:hypothetical protein
MPEFVEFSQEDSRSRREDPQFTWQARGLLTMNRAAFQALDEPEAITLLYDANERIVGFRKVDPANKNAHAVRKQPKSHTYRVGAQGFAAYHGIQTLRARRFVAHDYGSGIWGFALDEGVSVENRRGAHAPGPATASRWQVTTDGADVPALMRIRDVRMSHPGYMQRQEKLSSVRIGILVACDPLGVEPSTSELRNLFLGLLTSQPVYDAINAISYVSPNAPWKLWAGHGRFNLEAVLTESADDTTEAPVASALMLLPETGTTTFGRDTRFAELVIHIEVRRKDGTPGPAEPLNTWHHRLVKALNVPKAFAQFLTDNLKLATSAEPPTQFGVWLNTPHTMTELVDIENLPTLPGAPASNSFIGYAIAESSGVPATALAVELLRQMCDYTLHVQNYEPLLASLDNS